MLIQPEVLPAPGHGPQTRRWQRRRLVVGLWLLTTAVGLLLFLLLAAGPAAGAAGGCGGG